jgi:hypothetical protein
MADKSPRHATSKKPSKTIKQKRAAKKLKVQQAAWRDVLAAVRDGELTQAGRPRGRTVIVRELLHGPGWITAPDRVRGGTNR